MVEELEIVLILVGTPAVRAFGALVGMPIIFGTFGFFFGTLIALIAQGVGAARDRRGRRGD